MLIASRAVSGLEPGLAYAITSTQIALVRRRLPLPARYLLRSKIAASSASTGEEVRWVVITKGDLEQYSEYPSVRWNCLSRDAECRKDSDLCR
jgi:hypothetical protein